MRITAFALALCLLPLAAYAEETLPQVAPEEAPAVDTGPTREERIESLIETLKASTDEVSARSAERDLLRLWMESGSDTVDLLMTWAIGAIQEKNYPRALDFLDRVIVMKPEYAEGWNKRATVYFLIEDYSHSIADIGRVLELEPRHFGALSGLGMIMRALGDDDRAMAAYREALAVHPHLDGARDALDQLEAAHFGREL